MIKVAVVGMVVVIGFLVFLAVIGFTPAEGVLVVGLVLLAMAVHGGSRSSRRR